MALMWYGVKSSPTFESFDLVNTALSSQRQTNPLSVGSTVNFLIVWMDPVNVTGTPDPSTGVPLLGLECNTQPTFYAVYNFAMSPNALVFTVPITPGT